MEFKRVVGGRRSIRWFRTWKPVPRHLVQHVLEAARLGSSPGNLQPWKAVVVWPDQLAEADRDQLLAAGNRQPAHVQAPVWIYWFADLARVAPGTFMEQIELGLEVGSIAASAGWSHAAARAAIDDGTAPPTGMPPIHEVVHAMPDQVRVVVALQETIGACTIAQLAATDAGLGSCLHSICAPSAYPVVRDILGVPESYLPVWLQLLGHPAEDLDGGGQRPREPFEDTFFEGRYGTPFTRDAAVVADLAEAGLVQPPAPLPWRADELAHLSRMYDMPGAAG